MRWSKRLVIFCVMFFFIYASDIIEAGQFTAKKILKPLSIKVHLRVVTSTLFGLCPKTIKFTGTIYASRATPLSYRFIRSDGVTARVKHINFTSDGTLPVQTTWRVDKNTNGYVYLEVLTPFRKQSVKVTFNTKCLKLSTDLPPIELNLPRPYDISAGQTLNPDYLGNIGLKATIIPKHPNIQAVKDSLNGKNFRFFIGNKLVGTKQAKYPVTHLQIKAKDTPALNLKPGIHKVTVMTWHKNKLVTSSFNMTMGKARIKITESTARTIYYRYGSTVYGRCHPLNSTIRVYAKFTYWNFDNMPVKNTQVHFRTFGVIVATATTNNQGFAVFSVVLNPAAFLENTPRPQSGPIWPYTSENFNFYLPENTYCRETSDWGNPKRWIWACPQGTTLQRQEGYWRCVN